MHGSRPSMIFGASDGGRSFVMPWLILLLPRIARSGEACPCLLSVLSLRPIIAMGLTPWRPPGKDDGNTPISLLMQSAPLKTL
jgi:hypothetical protein